MEKKEMKRCPYCGEMILAAAKKCKYCGEWLENSEAIIADDKEEKLAPVVPKSKSKPVAEPAPEPEDATTDGDDEVVDTGYGVSVSKRLAKRITWGLVAVAIIAFAFLGYEMFSIDSSELTMSRLDGSWKEIAVDGGVERTYHFDKNGDFHEIATLEDNGIRFRTMIKGKWELTDGDVLGQCISLTYDLNTLYVDGKSGEEHYDADDPTVAEIKQFIYEQYQEDNKKTEQAKASGESYGFNRLSLSNDTIKQAGTPVWVKTEDVVNF